MKSLTTCVFWLIVACGGAGDGPTIRVDGRHVVVDGEKPLRAVLVDLEWEATLDVTAIAPAADAERMNLARVSIDGTRARVLLSDTRGIPMPARGTLLHVDATGDGAIRLVAFDLVEAGQP